jgi:putative CocE/NonD family hydrolase
LLDDTTGLTAPFFLLLPFALAQSFADFADASRSANGRHFRLTVGRWKHWDFMSYGAPSIKLAIDFFDRHVKGLGGPEWDELEEEGSPDAFPIQVGFLGTSPCRWIGLESWPPPRAALCAFPLTAAALPQQQQRQQQRQPLGEGAGCSHQRYDPTNPTPSLGGPSFDPHNGGCVEQGALEKREDVLAFTFTPDALGAQGSATYLCGDVYVDLHCASANPHTDFFFKLCDVDRDGQSWNVVEGIDRMTPEQWDSRDQEGWYHVRRRTKVGAVANVFKPGHAVRLQVSGGAHPLYLRNYGTGEPIADAVEFRVQDRKVFHDTQLLLPLMAKSDVEAATIAHPAYPDHVLEHEH